MIKRHHSRTREASEPASLIDQVWQLAHPLHEPGDLDPLLNRIGDAPFVLLGEASHGTADYYTWRATISRRLIEEKGFSFIGVEGDWPDCYQVNRYVKGLTNSGVSARDVLHAFQRWPTWMWANEEVVTLVEWLRQHNDAVADEDKVGFYGLDVYSLWESLYAILTYLYQTYPAALPMAWRAFRCFEPYGEDVQEYARATRFVPYTCEGEVLKLLQELRRGAPEYQADGREAYFQAEQNALVLKNAEAYYRAMIRGGPDSWNLRDCHMAETLERLVKHHGPRAKAIVWEHNTHIGDARFTGMAQDGMVNVGQLVRERHRGEEVVLVGFGSYRGSVIAAKEWDAPMELMEVPPGREGSWEAVLHHAGLENQLFLWGNGQLPADLLQPRGHRAIGVAYHPEHEHLGNYVPTVLPRRYDAFLYLDETHGLHPLHVPIRASGEVPETFPSGV
jgi:erythromycin esterase-like protein